EDRPWDAVGVAGGGRDEDREVGRLDEPVGQLAVRVLDRVDVRRVDEGKTRPYRRVADEADALAGHARERARPERRLIVRVGQDDGDPGRRTEDARRAGRPPHDRVEERALA